MYKNKYSDYENSYDLYKPESIEIVNGDIKKFIDIEVEDDNTFHIWLESPNQYLLTHNCDGDSITGLLMNFFSKWKELFKMGKIYKCLTPLVVIKKGNNKKYFYTQSEWDEYKKSHSVVGWVEDYKKGLGSLEDEEYKEMIQNPKKILIEWDDEADSLLECWFGNDSELRKKQLED